MSNPPKQLDFNSSEEDTQSDVNSFMSHDKPAQRSSSRSIAGSQYSRASSLASMASHLKPSAIAKLRRMEEGSQSGRTVRSSSKSSFKRRDVQEAASQTASRTSSQVSSRARRSSSLGSQFEPEGSEFSVQTEDLQALHDALEKLGLKVDDIADDARTETGQSLASLKTTRSNLTAKPDQGDKASISRGENSHAGRSLSGTTHKRRKSLGSIAPADSISQVSTQVSSVSKASIKSLLTRSVISQLRRLGTQPEDSETGKSGYTESTIKPKKHQGLMKTTGHARSVQSTLHKFEDDSEFSTDTEEGVELKITIPKFDYMEDDQTTLTDQSLASASRRRHQHQVAVGSRNQHRQSQSGRSVSASSLRKAGGRSTVSSSSQASALEQVARLLQQNAELQNMIVLAQSQGNEVAEDAKSDSTISCSTIQPAGIQQSQFSTGKGFSTYAVDTNKIDKSENQLAVESAYEQQKLLYQLFKRDFYLKDANGEQPMRDFDEWRKAYLQQHGYETNVTQGSTGGDHRSSQTQTRAQNVTNINVNVNVTQVHIQSPSTSREHDGGSSLKIEHGSSVCKVEVVTKGKKGKHEN